MLKGVVVGRVKGVVANKKSHFRPSDEMSMKKVDNDWVNAAISFTCYPDA